MGFRRRSPATSFLTGEERIAEGERAVITFEGAELVRGGGGPRCMTLSRVARRSLGLSDVGRPRRSAAPTRCSPSARPSFSAAGPADAQIAHLARLPASRRAAERSRSTWRRRCSPDTSDSRATRDGALAAARRRRSPRASRRARDGTRVELDDAIVRRRRRRDDRSRAYRRRPHHRDRGRLVSDGVATTVFDTLDESRAADSADDHGAHEHHVGDGAHAPRFAEVCDQLLGVLEGHVFVAHNANFDWRFMSMEIERATRRPLDRTDALHRAHGATARCRSCGAAISMRSRTTTASRITRGIAPAATRVATAQCFTAAARRGARSRHAARSTTLDQLSRTPSNRRRRRQACRTLFDDTTA